MPSEFVGVDGCPRGWFSVGFNASGEYELEAFSSFAGLVDHYAAAELILVDMAIGLPEGSAERLCDPEAREALGPPRASSVFRAPTRKATEHLARNPGDSAGARDVQIETTRTPEITGKSLSDQTLAIMPKIAEVDRVMPARQPIIREIHPEICFWALNNRCPMSFKKDNPKGIEERLCVLEQVEPRARNIYEAGCAGFYRKDVARDDILDALAAAVTAYRGWTDRLQTLPEHDAPQWDERGLPMEMVFWEPSLR